MSAEARDTRRLRSSLELHARFEAWCDERGIHLTMRQREAAKAVIFGVLIVGPGRASGKTFLLETLKTFLDER